MEHRQDGHPAVEDGLPVRVPDGGLDLRLVGIGGVPPVVPGVFLGDVRLAAGGVRADVRRLPVVAAGLHLIEGIGPGRHRLCLQGLCLKGGGHLRPDHPHQILPQGHLLHRVPVQDPQCHLSVQIPRLKGCRLRRLPAVLLRRGRRLPEGRHHRQGQGEQQRRQHRRDGGAPAQISMASHRAAPSLSVSRLGPVPPLYAPGRRKMRPPWTNRRFRGILSCEVLW